LAGSISNVVDKGQVISGLTDDFDAEKRPQGRGYEIGADEMSRPDFSSLSWLMLLLGK